MPETLASLAQNVVDQARSQNSVIVTAESCTGGMIAESITAIPGSSLALWGGFVTYANHAKTSILGVKEATLASFGAVSSEVVSEMVVGALERSGASLAVAVSGVAGPGGGTPDKPVGTVWLACGRAQQTPRTRVEHFPGDRASVRAQATAVALRMILEHLA